MQTLLNKDDQYIFSDILTLRSAKQNARNSGWYDRTQTTTYVLPASAALLLKWSSLDVEEDASKSTWNVLLSTIQKLFHYEHRLTCSTLLMKLNLSHLIWVPH